MVKDIYSEWSLIYVMIYEKNLRILKKLMFTQNIEKEA